MLLLLDSISRVDFDCNPNMERFLLPLSTLATHANWTVTLPLRGKPTPPFTPKAAEYCRHLLHPGTPQTQALCPTCNVNQRLDDLRTLTELWESKGSPLCPEEAKDAHYWKICVVWRTEKVCLVKYVGCLEKWADQERQWEDEHPGALDETKASIKSASEALDIARRTTPYVDWMDEDAEPERQRRDGVGGRKVRFQEDIVERPHRDYETFRRTSAKYSPGHWALSSLGEYQDTSFCYRTYPGPPEREKLLDEQWERNQKGMAESQHCPVQ
jgi:hypothetical protein